MRLLAVLLVAQAAVSCCDPRHDVYLENQKNVSVCTERGGVPITMTQVDDGGHSYTVLTQCILPCYPTLDIEKRQ